MQQARKLGVVRSREHQVSWREVGKEARVLSWAIAEIVAAGRVASSGVRWVELWGGGA